MVTTKTSASADKLLIACSDFAWLPSARVLAEALGKKELGARVLGPDDLGARRKGTLGDAIAPIAAALRGLPGLGDLPGVAAVGGGGVPDADVLVALDVGAAQTLCESPAARTAITVGLCGELEPDPAWAATACDRFVVADETARSALQGAGVAADRIQVGGIVVGAGVVAPDAPKAELRKRLGLAETPPLCLCLCAGVDESVLTSICVQLGLTEHRAQIVFFTAGDDDAARHLRKEAALYGLRAKLVSQAGSFGRLLAAADVVVCRPRAAEVAEAVVGHAVVIVLPGESPSEKALARAVVQRGLGRGLERVLTLSVDLDVALAQPAVDAAHKEHTALDLEHATSRVVDRLSELYSHRGDVLDARRTAGASAAGGEGALFEDIGVAASRESDGDVAGSVPAAHKRLESLLVRERLTRREMDEARSEVTKWEHFVDLARGKDEALEKQAQAEADRHRGRLHAALDELRHLEEEKKRLKETASAPQAPAGTPERKVEDAARASVLEDKFKSLAVDRELDRIKKKVEDEKKKH
jgi:hypothetical protein